ncbi:unnamed protein product [Paramecium sonneborni]|uniref:Uncharacterized protein n=1 Tax=Paramecium sonneborni TaxID=65129 RepID=A0A8S1Q2L7_9CILI|nr:unnamed protein product [Paramecium sonneborni]
MNKTDQNQASEIQKKVYPMRNSVYEILCNKENRDDFKLIQYGNIENDDQTQLVGTKEQLNQWMIQFKQQKQGDRIKAENESRLDRLNNFYIQNVLSYDFTSKINKTDTLIYLRWNCCWIFFLGILCNS